jgi:transposase-like protein
MGNASETDARSQKALDASFKAEVALAAIAGTETIDELANRFNVDVSQLDEWQAHLREHADRAFKD